MYEGILRNVTRIPSGTEALMAALAGAAQQYAALQQARKERDWRAQMEDKSRLFQAQQADKARAFQASQDELERKFRADLEAQRMAEEEQRALEQRRALYGYDQVRPTLQEAPPPPPLSPPTLVPPANILQRALGGSLSLHPSLSMGVTTTHVPGWLERQAQQKAQEFEAQMEEKRRVNDALIGRYRAAAAATEEGQAARNGPLNMGAANLYGKLAFILARKQKQLSPQDQENIGLRIPSYEEFMRDPNRWITMAGPELYGQAADEAFVQNALKQMQQNIGGNVIYWDKETNKVFLNPEEARDYVVAKLSNSPRHLLDLGDVRLPRDSVMPGPSRNSGASRELWKYMR